MTAWDEYLSWNEDIAEAVYPEIDQPRQVFLDVEGDALDRLAIVRGIQREEVIDAFLAAVRTTVRPGSQASAFKRHAEALKYWRRGPGIDPPPVIGLLAVFSLAAERMARGGGLAGHNYHGQLGLLLGVEDVRASLSYREVAEPFWKSLSDWLIYQNGRRGTPISFVLGEKRFVGLALAQALLRDTDRRRLKSFYQMFDLEPGTSLEPDQLEHLLGDWIRRSAMASKHIQNIWAIADARQHLCGAVANDLEAWDGVLEKSAHPEGTSRIRLTLRTRSLRRDIVIAPVLNLPQASSEREARLKTAAGSTGIVLTQSREGEMAIRDFEYLVTPADTLEGILSVDDPIAGRVSRQPRRLVVFRLDQATQTWKEVSQVRLGDVVQLLVHDDIQIDGTLSEVSGTDWTVVMPHELRGLPDRWRLIRGVTILARPLTEFSAFDDRAALTPLTTSTFSFSGGFRLPVELGRFAYLADAPPAIAAANDGDPFTLSLFDLEGEQPVLVTSRSSADGNPLLVDCAELGLESGDYGLTLSGSGKVSNREFSLRRSGDDALDRDVDSVAHDADRPLFAVAAENSLEAAIEIRGAAVTSAGTPPADLHLVLPNRPTWRRERTYERAPSITLASPEPDSCHYTGKHFELIDDARRDKRGYTHGTTLGVCVGCGRTKRYLASWAKIVRARERDRLAVQPATAPPPSLRTGRDRALGMTVDWDLLREAVICVGGGGSQTLRYLTSQIDPSARFFHEAVTTLEALGHIEIERDPQTLELVRWETGPTVVVQGTHSHTLIGHWTHALIGFMQQEGIDIQVEMVSDGPSRITTHHAIAELQSVQPELDVVSAPGSTLASLLPDLSAVLAALPRTTTPNSLNLDRYNTATDSWERAALASEPGAYRTGGYSRVYFIRTTGDVTNGTAAITNVGLAKHAASLINRSGAPMLFHDGETLFVPLGAHLPGMYGRSAVLASGRPPHRRDIGGVGSFIAYSNVPVSLASHLFQRLGA